MKTALYVLQVIFAIVIVVTVLLQPAKNQGLSGFVPGSSDTYFSKNKARTFETTMARLTIVFAILFAATTIGLNFVK